jgi:hypothetical protein
MKTRLLPVVGALALVTAACGGGGDDPTQVGIRRVALALAFSEAELAEPVAPNVIVQLVPAPPEAALTPEIYENPPPELFDSPFACPTAPPGAAPAVPVSFSVKGAPAPGSYPRHNTGTISIEGGPFPITFPYPFASTDEISPAEEVDAESAPGLPPTKVVEYEVKRVLGGGFETTDRFRVGSAAVELVKRTTVTPGETTVFEPTPPVDVYVFGVEGSSWNDAGVDSENGTAMAFQGTIEKREVVDVCGTAIDTYRVSAQETMVNLDTGQTSGTSSDDPNIYNVATQFGGLVVRADVHTTDTTRDPESGAPVVLVLEYVTTLDDVEPAP